MKENLMFKEKQGPHLTYRPHSYKSIYLEDIQFNLKPRSMHWLSTYLICKLHNFDQ